MTTPQDDLPELGAWDETLFEDGDAVADDFGLPEDPVLREAVLEQRFAHGLLVQHFDDKAAAERRVERIIGSLPASQAGGETNVIPFWRRFAPAVAAAALVSMGAAWLAGWFDDHDEIRALIAAARDHHDDPVDRHYRLIVHRTSAGGVEEKTGEHEFYVRPGGVFRVELDGVGAGRKTIGCDGTLAWRRSFRDGEELRAESTVEKVREMFEGAMRPEGFFDIGYLNVDRVLSKVPDAVHLFNYEVTLPGDVEVEGEMRLARVYGTANLDLGGTDLTYLEILADEKTGMVQQMKFDLLDEDTRETFRFDFKYLGELAMELSFYSRPW